jgi:3-(3-hydroxy-phenyl)propionate hydroxylase
MPRYTYAPFGYSPPQELTGSAGRRWPVAIVGAGPIGLALAIDLALHGVASVVLDDNDVVSVGSRAICWAKRTLEIFDRLGVGDRMLEKGVTWKVGRLFRGDEEVYSFDLLPEAGHKMPAFINLQQYYVEQYLVERAREFPDLIELRFKNKVTGLTRHPTHAEVTVETPDGSYLLTADYLIACDGAKSTVRGLMGLEMEGTAFEERFLIADIEMEADFPSERWFWFQPTFHSGQTALLHKQPDNIYRIDLQLGWDADPEVEKRHDTVRPRIEKAVGGRPFEIDWVSVYNFQCRRLAEFVHGPVIFAGDSAHVVSPFGARGGNGGIHDVDNLGWKLAAVIKGEAGANLLASYNEERGHGADENIRNSSRTTDFMSPPSPAAMLFRDEVLRMASDLPFARRLINSGRLSSPCSLAGLSLQTPDSTGAARVPPGTPCPDAPMPEGGYLLQQLGGRFLLVVAGDLLTEDAGLGVVRLPPSGIAADRYGPGVYLIRPDQHVAAWWSAEPRQADIDTALARASGLVMS